LKECSESDRLGNIRNLCRTDLFFLLRYGCARADIDRDWLFDRCREVQASPHGFLDLWAREHYKSTIITFGLTIQEILASHGDDPLIDEELTFGLFSHTRPIGKAFLRQIKVELETNERLKLWFPDVLWADPRKQALKWSEDDGIIVKRRSNPKEATVEAWGLVDGQPTSKHYRRMVYDDAVTRESVTTPEMIKKTTEAWELSRNLAAEGGESRYIGTRYHFLDTYKTLMDRGIKARIYPATKDGTASGDPVLMSRETLAKKRVEMAGTFNSQMLQNPSPDEDAYFKKDWFRWYDTAPKHVSKYGASDFAVTAKGGDFTVHIVVGVDPGDNIYILDVWRKQATTDVWIDQMIGLMQKHKPVYVWSAPADQIKRSVGPFLTKRMAEAKTYVMVKEASEAGDKPSKARSFQGRMALGKVYFPKQAEWLDDLVMEMSMFPVGHDDQVDALGQIGRMLDEMVGGRIPPVVDTNNRRDYSSRESDEIDAENDWKTV
jgi:predicted phage terminase large subunit-like protein